MIQSVAIKAIRATAAGTLVVAGAALPAVSLLMLSACGQKGPLTLPPPPASAAASSVAPSR